MRSQKSEFETNSRQPRRLFEPPAVSGMCGGLKIQRTFFLIAPSETKRARVALTQRAFVRLQ